jgi:hypothetical protein
MVVGVAKTALEEADAEEEGLAGVECADGAGVSLVLEEERVRDDGGGDVRIAVVEDGIR